MFAELAEFLRPLPKHLRRLWGPHIGTQVLFVAGPPIRIPKAGKTTEPYFFDHPYHPRLSVKTVKGIGVSGWDWCDQRSAFATFDLDSIANHGDGLTDEQLAKIVGRLMAVPEVELVRSKSGHGIHARVYFDPQPHALATPSTPTTGRVRWLGLRGRAAFPWNRLSMPAARSPGFGTPKRPPTALSC